MLGNTIDLKASARKMGKDELRKAFTNVRLSYGTTGHSGGKIPLSEDTLGIHESTRK